ncbi:hypothetical protein NKH73_05090 [Mesorhizobium sp. M0938]|uniref:hypothetical protein n=1 Tax=unclassified Mesorhizobium TaxID=325217 RepID=UPI00333CB1AB
MDGVFFALWKSSGRKPERRENYGLHPRPSGLGRLLVAVAIIGVATCVLDHMAARKGAVVAASYGSSQQGR